MDKMIIYNRKGEPFEATLVDGTPEVKPKKNGLYVTTPDFTFPVRTKNVFSETWYLNGQFHREDGPAIILHNGHESWYFHGSKKDKPNKN